MSKFNQITITNEYRKLGENEIIDENDMYSVDPQDTVLYSISNLSFNSGWRPVNFSKDYNFWRIIITKHCGKGGEVRSTYSVGQQFKENRTGDIYLLAQTDNYIVNLIGLKTGNRYSIGEMVKKPYEITEEEFKVICAGDNFELIRDE